MEEVIKQLLFTLFSSVLTSGFIGYLIKLRLENSIIHENQKQLEEYKYNIEVRKQASKVSEYLALVRDLKETSSAEDYRRANQLSWELAMWLPDKIYKQMTSAIKSPNSLQNPLTVIIEVRKLLLKEPGKLTQNDVAHHAPGIGKK